jgi:hypothetical protein
MDRSRSNKSAHRRTHNSAGLASGSAHRDKTPLGRAPTAPRSYTRREAIALLRLTNQQFLELERTGQLSPITICGKQKFLSKDLELLIDTYQQVARRKSELNSYPQSRRHGGLYRKRDKKQ